MKDIDMVKIGQRIKELRNDCELTQKELAQLIGVAQNTITQYENGSTKPSLEVLVKLADALNATTDYILCGQD